MNDEADQLRDAWRSRSALELIDEFNHDPRPITLGHRLSKATSGAHARPDRNGRRKTRRADAVIHAVEGAGQVQELGLKVRRETERQESVYDRPAERPLASSTFRVGVDPLTCSCGAGECLHIILGHLRPLGHSEIGGRRSHELLDRVESHIGSV